MQILNGAWLCGLYSVPQESDISRLRSSRIILEELGHKQPPTPLQTDNAMANAVINGKIQPKQTKAMDMKFHWLRDRECQQQFRIYWRPGKMNHANYWTKIIQNHITGTYEKNSSCQPLSSKCYNKR